MPVRIYRTTPEGQENDDVAWLCDSEWSLTPQVEAFSAWLQQSTANLPPSDYVADIGFCWRRGAASGGPVLSVDMMRRMADAGIALFLSEYPGFAEDHLTPESLAAFNSGCAYAPKDFDRETALQRARAFYVAVRNSFPNAIFDDQVQDATYHAGIGVGEAEIRLSNFGRLATITSEEKLSSDAIGQLAEQIRAAEYTYVPFAVFGEPFSKRPRFNGDLFTQLFDYV